MARTGTGNPLDSFIDTLVDEIATRLQARVGEIAGGGRGRAGAAGRPVRRLDMRCHFPGCRNRSKGPRFRFLCDEHLKLPKKEQDAALAKWAEQQKAA